jgi:adenine-specific DNA-methyltransferase
VTRKQSKHAFADGFEENVEFFRLDYLDKDDVELGRAFEAINPCLWLMSGARGSRRLDITDRGWGAAVGGGYAVLFDETRLRAFKSLLSRVPAVQRVFLVTDSEEAYAEMVDALGAQWSPSMLYRDYLRNFQINTAETL